MLMSLINRKCRNCGKSINDKRIDSVFCCVRCNAGWHAKQRHQAVLLISAAADAQGLDAAKVRKKCKSKPMSWLRREAHRAEKLLMSLAGDSAAAA